MKKQFKKGDLVRCIDDSVCGALITKGNIYKVMENQTDNFVSIMDEGESIVTLFDARFELAEQPTTEDLSKIKFKTGDKLMCIESSSLRSITKGKIYTALSDESEFMQHIKVVCDYGTVQEYPRTQFELYKPAEEQPEQVDMVNNPPHYNQGSVECIEAIKAALTDEEFRGYCKGNAIKYIWREKHKGGQESIEKANWYLNKL